MRLLSTPRRWGCSQRLLGAIPLCVCPFRTARAMTLERDLNTLLAPLVALNSKMDQLQNRTTAINNYEQSAAFEPDSANNVPESAVCRNPRTRKLPLNSMFTSARSLLNSAASDWKVATAIYVQLAASISGC